MGDKLIFTKADGHSGAFLISHSRLKAATFFSSRESITGGIYVARVRDVVKNLNACFVEIDKERICFLSAQDKMFPCILNGQKCVSQSTELHQGDLLLVQGIKEAQKNKQAAVTTRVSVSSPYFAVSFGSPKTGYSTKLSDTERNRLIQFTDKSDFFDENRKLRPLSELVPMLSLENVLPAGIPDAGVVFRTECGNAADEILTEALATLLREFISMISSAFYRSAFTCIQEPPAPWKTALQELILPGECEEIVTDDPVLYTNILQETDITAKTKVRLYEDQSYPLEKLYSLNTRIQEALGTRIWLKSGAYLIIEPTEALTVIDVNSGKFEAHRGDKEFIRLVNLEAAEEIAHQLRLRNVSGMVLVDFINMQNPEDQKELILRMTELVKKDRVRTCVVDFTRLGLMEITRAKKMPPLKEQAFRAGWSVK